MRSLEERNKLVEENINFVRFIIKKYFKGFVLNYPYLQDNTFSEGCIGLCKAADYFDSEKGIEFTTFAAVCIKGQILKFISRYAKKHYRTDVDSIEKCVYRDGTNKDIKLIDALKQNENTEIDMIELYISESKIKNIRKIVQLRKRGYTQKEVGDFLGVNQMTISRSLKMLRKEI